MKPCPVCGALTPNGEPHSPCLLTNCTGCGQPLAGAVERFRVSPNPGEPFHDEAWHRDCYERTRKPGPALTWLVRVPK